MVSSVKFCIPIHVVHPEAIDRMTLVTPSRMSCQDRSALKRDKVCWSLSIGRMP